jgi:hypothetical protein|tara:strand:+ start:71 stop:172 length:102 start_codon:yes stop_codon:yes gene_type:complete
VEYREKESSEVEEDLAGIKGEKKSSEKEELMGD